MEINYINFIKKADSQNKIFKLRIFYKNRFILPAKTPKGLTQSATDTKIYKLRK